MTATATRDWMKTGMIDGRSIFSRWILPEAGLYDSILGLDGKRTKRYAGRPPGNLPLLMALDEFGNKNIVACVNRHISATKKEPRGTDVMTDPKYEFCDVKRASRALRRCWDPKHGPDGGAPLGKTIVAGHTRIWGKHLGEIRAAKGTMVGGRSGHRRAEEPRKIGGPQVKGQAPWEGEGEWLNADARPAQARKFKRCTDLCATSGAM